MRAGTLRHRIAIQERSTARDSRGGQSQTWTPVVTDLPAAAEPLRGREFAALQAAQADLSIRFRIRYRAGITPAMRVVWEGRNYGIVEVIDVGGRHRELELMCRGDANG